MSVAVVDSRSFAGALRAARAHHAERFRAAAYDAATIKGHPTAEIYHDDDRPTTQISLCENCGRLRTIIWWCGDRWRCTGCRHEGRGRPTPTRYPNPRRRRR